MSELEHPWSIEERCFAAGYETVCGADEAGAGPPAGRGRSVPLGVFFFGPGPRFAGSFFPFAPPCRAGRRQSLPYS